VCFGVMGTTAHAFRMTNTIRYPPFTWIHHFMGMPGKCFDRESLTPRY
jgi:hypothetical protein